jgi:uroporphyrinogen III methyltransferase/synthase
MEPVANSRPLSGRTILVSPSQADGELAIQLEHHGARVLAWPRSDIGEPETYEVFDDTIENLFGYDWLVFQNALAVDFFLRRFRDLGHGISDLDSLRVCGVGKEAAALLEESLIHLDVIPDGLSFQATVDAIATYVGGPEALRGLNLLVPSAGNFRAYLQEAMEGAGARVDLIAAYRTCAANDPEPARLEALIAGGGIDCIVFENSAELRELTEVFDTNDLGRRLAGVTVACSDMTVQAAARFSLAANVVKQGGGAMAQAIASFFRAD